MDLKLGPSSKDIRILKVKRDLVKEGGQLKHKRFRWNFKKKEKIKWDTFKEILGNVDPVVGVKLYRDAKAARASCIWITEGYRKITRLKDAKKLRQALLKKRLEL